MIDKDDTHFIIEGFIMIPVVIPTTDSPSECHIGAQIFEMQIMKYIFFLRANSKNYDYYFY